MVFTKLVEFWVAVDSGYDFSNKEFSLAYKKANENFKRADVPGGCLLYGHQEMAIDEDILSFVNGQAGGTAWDHFIDFRPIGRKSKAARIVAKRTLVPDVPEQFFNQSIKVRFGWELVQLPIDWKEFNGVVLRPRLTKFGDLSHHYFDEWISYFDLKKDQKEILLGLSGPRKKSFITIVLGDNWETRCYSI